MTGCTFIAIGTIIGTIIFLVGWYPLVILLYLMAQNFVGDKKPAYNKEPLDVINNKFGGKGNDIFLRLLKTLTGGLIAIFVWPVCLAAGFGYLALWALRLASRQNRHRADKDIHVPHGEKQPESKD